MYSKLESLSQESEIVSVSSCVLYVVYACMKLKMQVHVGFCQSQEIFGDGNVLNRRLQGGLAPQASICKPPVE